MVAIADDLFLSALEMPKDMLESSILGHLKETRCGCVGAVLFLYVVKPSAGSLEYRHYLIPNPTAIRPLPLPVVKGLTEGNYRDS